jgi:hypothetical protein
VIGPDVKNTTLPNMSPGKSPLKGNPMEKDFRRQMLRQILVDRMKKEG